MSSISFDRAAGYYDATRGYPPGVGEQVAGALVVAAQATPDTRFLELGIGTGRIALPIILMGYSYSGVDLSPAMMAQLRTKLDAYLAEHPEHPPVRLDLREGDSTRLPFPDAQFDVALMVHVLHLIPNWQDAVREALRVLKPGGTFLNGGDEALSNGLHRSVQDLWLDIVKEIDPNASQLGLMGFATSNAVVRYLEELGLHPEHLRTVTWTASETPRQAFAFIRERLWSRTWLLPDDLFAESVQRLEHALLAQFGDQIDTPVTREMQFVILRTRTP